MRQLNPGHGFDHLSQDDELDQLLAGYNAQQMGPPSPTPDELQNNLANNIMDRQVDLASQMGYVGDDSDKFSQVFQGPDGISTTLHPDKMDTQQASSYLDSINRHLALHDDAMDVASAMGDPMTQDPGQLAAQKQKRAMLEVLKAGL